MAAPIRIGRALAAVMLHDLPDYLADAEENGIARPKVELRHGDRLSRADARTLYAWAMAQPDVREALRDARHPGHELARGFVALVNHFLHDHPQGADGEPAPWPEPLSPALAGLLAGTRETIEAGELKPAEARDMIAWAQMQSDHAAALHDRHNPEHADVAREFQDLHARGYAEGSTEAPASASKTAAATPADTTAQARIAELRAHPAFHDGRHPEHRGVIAELGNLLARSSEGTRPAPAAAVSGITAAAAATPAVPGVSRAAELTQALRGNRLFGSTDRRQTLAALEAELLAGGTPGSAEPPAGE
jgi:hypothetical protein